MVRVIKDPLRLRSPGEVATAIEVRDKTGFIEARIGVEKAKNTDTDISVWITARPWLNAFADLETASTIETVTPRSVLQELLGRSIPPSLSDELIQEQGLIERVRSGEVITIGQEEWATVEGRTGTGQIMTTAKRPVVTDGRNMQDLRLRLTAEVGPESTAALATKAAEVVGNLPDPAGPPTTRQGLMFGRIQSGKTINIITTLAMAADNDYRCFVVLTSDNIWLYEQTLDRLKRSLPGLPIIGKDEWETKADSIGYTLKLNGVIFVATKNITVLTRLEELLRLVKARPFPALIIDDEADQASLNTNANRPEEDPTRINEMITVLRDSFDVRGFLQVTATPQALFLQSIGHPYRPEFTVLTNAGPNYVGGQTFFETLDNPHLKLVDPAEMDHLVDAQSQDLKIPEGLRQSICTFYMAATLKLLYEPNATFSYLCHVSLKQAAHKRLGAIIQSFQRDLTLALSNMKSAAEKAQAIEWLQEAYYDLTQTTKGAPAFEDLIERLAFSISSTEVQVLNAANSQGQPNYASRFNILIGGAKLGRGVTIHRLLVTYYGRQTKSPQMDTVLQHARMYGYRQKDMDVSRIFLTEQLARRFQLIYQSEEALRGVIEQFPGEGYEGILVGENLKATRGNVIDPNEVGFFAAGKSYFPPFPEFRQGVVEPLTSALDDLMAGIPEGTSTEVPLDTVLHALELARSLPGKEQGLWQNRRVTVALQKIANRPGASGKAYICKFTNRNLTNKRDGLGAVAAAGEVQEHRIPDSPTLLMYRQNGTADGWDGVPFWIPVISFPDGNYAAVFNYA